MVKRYRSSPYNSLSSAASALARRGGQYVLRRSAEYAAAGARRAVGRGAAALRAYVTPSRGTPQTRVSPNMPRRNTTLARRPSAVRRLNFGRSGRSSVRFQTTGAVGRKFSRKVTSRVNKFVTKGFIRKREVGGIVTNTQCCYLGHNTHAVSDMWKVICNAVMRWFAQKIGQDFTANDQRVSGLLSDPNMTLEITYKQTPDGLVLTASVTTVGSQGWFDLADKLLF